MKTLDLTDHPKDRSVTLPKRGPLALRYLAQDGGVRMATRVSIGLAAIYLRQAGYTVVKGSNP